VAQARCLQVGSNLLNGLDRLDELRFGFPVPAEPRQDLAKGRLPQPHLTGYLEALGHVDRGCQRLCRLRESPTRRQDLPLQPVGTHHVLTGVGLRGQR
jgi:hypothetical protein